MKKKIKLRAIKKATRKQIEFANDMTSSVLFIVAGYGFGKSDAAAMRAINLRKYEADVGSYAAVCIIAHSYPILKDSSIPKVIAIHHVENKQ